MFISTNGLLLIFCDKIKHIQVLIAGTSAVLNMVTFCIALGFIKAFDTQDLRNIFCLLLTQCLISYNNSKTNQNRQQLLELSKRPNYAA